MTTAPSLRRYSTREIAEAEPLAEADLMLIDLLGVPREVWCKRIGRDPRHDESGDKTALVIYELEGAIEAKPPAESIAPGRGQRRDRARAGR